MVVSQLSVQSPESLLKLAAWAPGHARQARQAVLATAASDGRRPVRSFLMYPPASLEVWRGRTVAAGLRAHAFGPLKPGLCVGRLQIICCRDTKPKPRQSITRLRAAASGLSGSFGPLAPSASGLAPQRRRALRSQCASGATGGKA